jgi:acyl carrier protein
MNREHVVGVIIKHLQQNVDGLADQKIDTSRSMLDMGATSLDVVEIVSSVMRELEVKVARTQFANVKNIDQLADMLWRVKTGG